MEERFLSRAKRTDNCEWVEGYYFCMVHDDGRHIHHFIIPLGTDLSLGTPIEKIQVEVDLSTICQCTGHKDKNGKIAYEYDILKTSVGLAKIVWRSCHTPQPRKMEVGFGVVFFDQSSNDYYRHDLGYWLKEGEIIGNVFDNSELIPEKPKETT